MMRLYHASMTDHRGRALLLALVFVFMAATLPPQASAPSRGSPATLSAADIVDRMQACDRARTEELKRYQTLRHYQVEYRGFSATLQARMDVQVTYDIASGKSLQIVSQSGPKFLVEKVLKRAVDSEREAFQQRSSTAMTPANYRFHLAGSEPVAGRPAYILDVEPIVPGKFLYRGKVWVDAADFAIVKMETEPAKSPSFWISRTLIHYTGSKTAGFWMPQTVQSETQVRIGGKAVLTIDYGAYRIESTPPQLAAGGL